MSEETLTLFIVLSETLARVVTRQASARLEFPFSMVPSPPLWVNSTDIRACTADLSVPILNTGQPAPAGDSIAQGSIFHAKISQS